jgi:WD40 repeat protein
MKSLPRLRSWFALSLGISAAFVACIWPASPRATVKCELAGWHFAFSCDSTKLAVLDRGPGLQPAAQILVVDVATGHVLRRMDIEQSTYPSKVVFAPDGESLGILDAGFVTKWDPNTGRPIARYERAEWSHDADHWLSCEILFSATGRWLLHNVREGRVCDVVTGEIVHDYHERWPDRTLTVHGGVVAALAKDEVKTFDVLTGAEMGSFPTARPRFPMARTALTFSGDGTQGIYFGDTDQWVAHNAIDGRECHLDISSGAGLHDICISADNRYVAVSLGSDDGNAFAAMFQRLFGTRWSVRVFDTTSGKEVGQSIRHGFTSCFAPDGRTLAVASNDNRVTLWDWPPPPRWPLMFIVATTTVLLSYGVGVWWSWRHRRALGGLSASGPVSP